MRRVRPGMGFQKRLVLTYSVLVFILVVVLALLFYRYSKNLFEKNALDTYSLLAYNMSNQLDNTFLPMDYITDHLISDGAFRSALSSLHTLRRDEPDNSRFLTEAEQAVRFRLATYSIIKNFYAVVVFNRKNDLFSSNYREHLNAEDEENKLLKMSWIPAATKAAGSIITVPPFVDPLDSENDTMVFGRARSLPGYHDELGFIAVLGKLEKLDPLFSIPDPDYVKVLVFLEDGNILFSSHGLDVALENYYRTASHALFSGFISNPLNRAEEAFVTHISTDTGISVVLVIDRKILLLPLTFVRNLTVGVGFLLILFSLVYNVISSRLLTKPLKLITARMEETELSNLSDGQPIEHLNDEIRALDRAFIGLMGRLEQSIAREFDLKTLWMQARFDSLQARVNPHFINNILTVIAGRGMELGDENIGEICDAVASMLRYSTGPADHYTTVGKELEHVGLYLYLMKQRLEERLFYKIDIDPEITSARLPKIVFQQFVENSITHGFNSYKNAMNISVKGYKKEDAWFVEIIDDGTGFPADKLLFLKKRFNEIESENVRGTIDGGLEIGGLGLINTYIRLHLFYNGNFIWHIENVSTGGVKVLVGGPVIIAD